MKLPKFLNSENTRYATVIDGSKMKELTTVNKNLIYNSKKLNSQQLERV